MDIVVRGNVLEFSTTFFDEEGAPVNPVSVTLKLRVASPGVATQPDPVELTMVRSGNVWSVRWDTSGIPMGTVFWAVQSAFPHSADEGNFELTANTANVWA